MDDEQRSDHAPGLDDLRQRVVTEGTRRLRRRRVSAAGVVGVLVAAGIFTVSAALHGTGHPTRVATGDSGSAAACLPAGPAEPGVAQAGASATFGHLPAGYHLQAGSDGTVARAGTGMSPQLHLGVGTVDPNSRFGAGPITPNTTVEGHPAHLEDSTSPVSVDWQPDPATEIYLTGYGITGNDLLAVANDVVYHPGHQAGAVGDLGSVIPRSDAIKDLGESAGTTTQTVTWLVTNQELTAALPLAGESPNGEAEQGAPPDRPLWVVAQLGTYINNTEARFNNGPNGGSAHVIENVVDGVTGFSFLTVTAGDATIGAEFASLTDHSLDQPCPSPSPTSPNSLAPRHEPTAFPATTPTIATTTTTPDPGATIITINAGTNQGVTQGDTVTTTPSPGAGPGALVGTVDQLADNTSTVQLIDAPISTIPVALDSNGDDAVITGHGPNQALQAELVNRNLTLHPGTKLLTTGPPDSPVAGGIPIGTITTTTTRDGTPYVLVTPAYRNTTLDHLTVIETTKQPTPTPPAG